MKTQQAQLFLTAILLASSVLFVGCGPQTIGTNSETLSSISSDPSEKNVLSCSQGTGNSVTMNLKLMSDSSGVRNDLIGVRFTSIPSNFSATNTNEIQIFAEKFNSANVSIGVPRVSFYLIDANTGKYLSSNLYSALSWADMKRIHSAFLGSDITTVAEFISRVNLMVQINDTSGSTKLLRAFIFENLNQPPTREINGLIPKFLANPEEYKKTKPEALAKYHPLNGLKYPTVDDYIQKSNEFCF